MSGRQTRQTSKPTAAVVASPSPSSDSSSSTSRRTRSALAPTEPSVEPMPPVKKEQSTEEPKPGPAPKKTEESSTSPNTVTGPSVKATADSSSSPTREMSIKDWTEFQIDQTRQLSVVFREHIESIDNNCFKADKRKLDLNNNASYTSALGMVKQLHMAIKSHVELLQELDTRMCDEFVERYPKKANFSFTKIEPPVSSSTDAQSLFSDHNAEGNSKMTAPNGNDQGEEEEKGETMGSDDPLPLTPAENAHLTCNGEPDSSEDEEYYKSALLADDDDLDVEEETGRQLRHRNKTGSLKEQESDSDVSWADFKIHKHKSKKPLRRTSTGLSEFADALDDLETAPMSPIREDKAESDEYNEAEGSPGQVNNVLIAEECTIDMHRPELAGPQVVLTRLDDHIMDELDRNKFVKLLPVASGSDDDVCKKLAAALRRKITVDVDATESSPRSGKPFRKTTTSKQKSDGPALGLLSNSDSEDDDLEAIRLRKQELPSIRPKPLSELLSSPESPPEAPDTSDEEEIARRKLMCSDEDDEDEEETNKSHKKENKNDREEAEALNQESRRAKTPYIGPAVNLMDSDSDKSDSGSKNSKRTLRSRNTKNGSKESKKTSGPDTEEMKSKSADSDEEQKLRKSKRAGAKKEKQEKENPSSPSKTGLVLDSDAEDNSKPTEKNKSKAKNGEKSKTNEGSTKKSETGALAVSDDSDSDTPLINRIRKKKEKQRGDKDNNDKTSAKKTKEDSEASDDSDFIPSKKAKIIKTRKGEKSSGSDSDIQEVSPSESESGSSGASGSRKKKGKPKAPGRKQKGSGSDSSTKKKKPRRRIKNNSSSENNEADSEAEEDVDASQGSGKGRKNIRKLIKVKDLQVTTKEAAKQEEARKQRLLERQKVYNQIFKPPESDKLESLVLDFNKDTKEALVSVDPAIVTQLKPHQAEGIKFMWNACFESLETKKQGGAILAHCMGLGKTLQSVAFIHTLVTHKQTGVRTVLVICPLNTVENWYTEFRKWTRNATGRVNLHRLWDDKGNERFKSLQLWHKHGGAGILHYEGFRTLINSDQKKGRFKVQSRFLQIIKETLVDPGPDLVICDEGHLLKNASSLISKAVNRVKTQRRVVLTGTPLQNNLNEYHTMMSFVKPSLLGDIKEFRNRFVNPILNGQHKDSSGYDVVLMKKRAHVLHKLLEGCVQRLDYTVLTPFLPPKFEYAICVNLTEKQKDLYDYYIKNFARQQGESFATSKLFTDYTILNKICTHPIVLTYKTQRDLNREESSGSEGSLKDFICDDESTSAESSSASDAEGDEEKPKKPAKKIKTRSAAKADGEEPEIVELPDETKNRNMWYKQFFENDEEMHKIELSGKLRVLMEILRVAESVGDKVLIFSQYLTTLDLIEEFLADIDEKAVEDAKANKAGDFLDLSGSRSSEGRYRAGIDYFRIDGSTKSNIRQDQCDKFNQDFNKAKAFLISIKAGGLGINLHGANRVVIFDASWNPSQDLQAIFRVYRFGQTKPSYIYRLLARGTMEERIYNRQVVKLSLSCRVVDEQQIERHYHYDDLQKMYHFERDDPTERPIPIVPKDKLLAGLLQSHKDWVFSYLEHDSLLENKEEEELSEEAKKTAWEEFNNEGTRMANTANQITVESCHLMYMQNPHYFMGGNRDWCIYTMQRLHQLHPTADLVMLASTVKDMIKILSTLVAQHRIMMHQVPTATPEDLTQAVDYFKNYTKKIRVTYRDQLNFNDINYLGPATGLTDEFIKAVVSPRITRPYPPAAAATAAHMQQLAANFIAGRQQGGQRPVVNPSVVTIGNMRHRMPTASSFPNVATAMFNQFNNASNGSAPSWAAQAFTNQAQQQQQGQRASINSVPTPYVPPPQIVDLDE